MQSTRKAYDPTIVGAGPSELTAGIYAARVGLKIFFLKESCMHVAIVFWEDSPKMRKTNMNESSIPTE